jgi:hypothetical protein
MKLKNHMKNKGKRIQARMNSTFGISTDLFIKCCQGDHKSLKQLGQMGREGALVSKLVPKVQAAALATIKGTEDLNVAIANIVTQAASSSIAIDKAEAQVTLAQQRYQHDRKEIAADFSTSKQIENLRHSLTIDYVKLNAWIEQNMMSVDGQAKMLESVNRPEMKQIDTDIAYQDKVAEHYLRYGDASRPELIPEKKYLSGGFGGIIGRIKSAIIGI